MKTGIKLLALLFTAGVANAQNIKESEVPTAVKQAFNKAFPGMTVNKWEKEGEKFEAEYKKDKVENSVLMDASGNILETEAEIGIAELPSKISEYVTANYPGKKIKEASKITDPAGISTY